MRRASKTPKKRKTGKTIWENLKNLEDSVIEERLGAYLDTYEMKTLLERKQKMIAHVEDLFVKRGVDSVLFDLEN